MASPYSALALSTLSIGALFFWAVSFLVKAYRWRLYIAKLRAQGLVRSFFSLYCYGMIKEHKPMPPWSPVFGHLGIVGGITRGLPNGAHGHYLPDQISKEFPGLGPNYYLDLYPVAPSMLILTSPDALYQVTQQHSLPKFHGMRTFLNPLTEGMDLVTMEGETWKKWRRIFNPGFSGGHLMTLVPAIVRETVTFCNILGDVARDQTMVKMKDLTDNLAMDVIGQVTLDTSLNCQTINNTLVTALKTQIRWLSFGAEPNPLERYHPLRPLVHWYYSRKVNAEVSRRLKKRFTLYQTPRLDANAEVTKSVMDLALSTYTSEQSQGIGGLPEKRKLDPSFEQICRSQMKLFLFSGHDTTSSSTCYTLYLLSRHPKYLEKVRAEHDSILGSDPKAASEVISDFPYVLNRIPFTTAIIKESLRLFPVVSSTRAGEPNFFITDLKTGLQLPTNHFLVWSNPHAVHHDSSLWPRAEEFLPERWLVGAEDPLHPIKGAWRAFEHGPRNCIGQELAMLEMKIILTLVCRQFEVKDCYEELDGRAGKKGGTVNGERAYQIQPLGQPEGDLPCRIEMAKWP